MKNTNENLGFLALVGLLLIGVVILSGCIGEEKNLHAEQSKEQHVDEEPIREVEQPGEQPAEKEPIRKAEPPGEQPACEEPIREVKQPIKRECEEVDDYTVGDPDNIVRSSASKKKVLGQFGCIGNSPYSPKSGYAEYSDILVSETGNWSIRVAYSCNNAHSVPISIYLDGESEPRAEFYPKNTYDWNKFRETDKINIGAITAGYHSVTFKTDGANFGVADLDYFVLSTQ